LTSGSDGYSPGNGTCYTCLALLTLLTCCGSRCCCGSAIRICCDRDSSSNTSCIWPLSICSISCIRCECYRRSEWSRRGSSCDSLSLLTLRDSSSHALNIRSLAHCWCRSTSGSGPSRPDPYRWLSASWSRTVGDTLACGLRLSSLSLSSYLRSGLPTIWPNSNDGLRLLRLSIGNLPINFVDRR
jgi:hypothetical protein